MADGRKYLLRWSIGPWFDLENRIGGIILAADDMTRSRELEQEVLDIAGQFQQRLSVDLHDTVCQELTALAIYAESLGFSIPEDDHQARTILGRIEDGLKRCTADVRQLIHGKLPVNVTGQGFVQAIQEMATNDNQWSKWQIKVIIDSSPVNLDDFTATQLYMIIKEAVHNAIKHARPEEIRICISARPHLCISVQNQLAEGQKATGFVQKTGLGRKIMEHRAAMIGGQIRFETTEKYRVQLSCELERIAYDR
jgi:signal transduction histidine kinase